jgi:hypothetical protein
MNTSYPTNSLLTFLSLNQQTVTSVYLYNSSVPLLVLLIILLLSLDFLSTSTPCSDRGGWQLLQYTCAFENSLASPLLYNFAIRMRIARDPFGTTLGAILRFHALAFRVRTHLAFYDSFPMLKALIV